MHVNIFHVAVGVNERQAERRAKSISKLVYNRGAIPGRMRSANLDVASLSFKVETSDWALQNELVFVHTWM